MGWVQLEAKDYLSIKRREEQSRSSDNGTSSHCDMTGLVTRTGAAVVRVLILGDGDCTFSASLSTALQKSDLSGSPLRRYELVATCFDSEEEVLLKYPFSIKAIQALRALPLPTTSTENVEGRLLFEVNATASLESLTQADDKHREGFQHIIFNFPHIGEEHCHLHAALLKHVLYRANEVLQDEGCIHISLADGQAASWRLHGAASEQKLHVVKEISFQQEQWPGYETRRHQSGKSFNSRVDSSVSYLLKRESSLYRDCDDIFTFAMSSHKLSPSDDANGLGNNEAQLKARKLDEEYTGSMWNKNENRNRNKKRKIVEDTQHLIEVVSETSPCIYRCKKCRKTFSILRGVQTHIYQMHILVDTDGSEGAICANVDKRYYCDECDGREFPNEEALKQHQRAKHSGIKPFIKYLKPKSIYEGNFHCNVCGMGFNTEQECVTHMTNGITPSSLKDSAEKELKCELCNKRFRDQRALIQHGMSCKGNM